MMFQKLQSAKCARFAVVHLFHIQARNKPTAQSSVQERQGGVMQHNIMMYQIMSDILKNWLKTGIINKKEYQVMNTRMAEKYGISLSGIFVDNI